MPSIYYIGVGKTGSIAIHDGLPRRRGRAHSENYFEWVYGTKVLTRANASLLDVVDAVGRGQCRSSSRWCASRSRGGPAELFEYVRTQVKRARGWRSQRAARARSPSSGCGTALHARLRHDARPPMREYGARSRAATWPARFGVDVIGGFNASRELRRAPRPWSSKLLRHEDARTRRARAPSSAHLGYQPLRTARSTHGKGSEPGRIRAARSGSFTAARLRSRSRGGSTPSERRRRVHGGGARGVHVFAASERATILSAYRDAEQPHEPRFTLMLRAKRPPVRLQRPRSVQAATDAYAPTSATRPVAARRVAPSQRGRGSTPRSAEGRLKSVAGRIFSAASIASDGGVQSAASTRAEANRLLRTEAHADPLRQQEGVGSKGGRAASIFRTELRARHRSQYDERRANEGEQHEPVEPVASRRRPGWTKRVGAGARRVGRSEWRAAWPARSRVCRRWTGGLWL